jgi:hypothetical protein
MKSTHFKYQFLILLAAVISGSCNNSNNSTAETKDTTSISKDTTTQQLKPISQPLISAIYTADPSAHVFDGRIYIYPSHDIDAVIPENE